MYIYQIFAANFAESEFVCQEHIKKSASHKSLQECDHGLVPTLEIVKHTAQEKTKRRETIVNPT